MTLNSVRRIALSGRFCGVSAHHPQHLSAGGLRIAAAYSSATIPLSSSSSGGSFSPSSSSSKVRRDGSRLVTPGRLGPVRSFGITDTLANFAMKTVESSKGTTDLLASCCIVSYRIAWGPSDTLVLSYLVCVCVLRREAVREDGGAYGGQSHMDPALLEADHGAAAQLVAHVHSRHEQHSQRAGAHQDEMCRPALLHTYTYIQYIL